MLKKMLLLVVLFGATAQSMQKRNDGNRLDQELRLRKPINTQGVEPAKQQEYFSGIDNDNSCCMALALIGILLPVTLGNGQ